MLDALRREPEYHLKNSQAVWHRNSTQFHPHISTCRGFSECVGWHMSGPFPHMPRLYSFTLVRWIYEYRCCSPTLIIVPYAPWLLFNFLRPYFHRALPVSSRSFHIGDHPISIDLFSMWTHQSLLAVWLFFLFVSGTSGVGGIVTSVP